METKAQRSVVSPKWHRQTFERVRAILSKGIEMLKSRQSSRNKTEPGLIREKMRQRIKLQKHVKDKAKALGSQQPYPEHDYSPQTCRPLHELGGPKHGPTQAAGYWRGAWGTQYRQNYSSGVHATVDTCYCREHYGN